MSVASQSARGGGQFVDADLDLSTLGTTVWRKKWRILRPALLVGLVTLLVVEVISPRYQSESRVIVEGRDNIYLRPDADKDTLDRTVDQEAVTSQAQLILSRDLANAVIDKLKLAALPEFDPALGGVSPVRAILGMLGIVRNPMSMTPQERVLEAYYDRLNVYPVDKSRVIVIDFLSEDPELAARVANAIADGYLELLSKVKQDQAQTAGQALSGEIESMRKKVLEAEGRVEAYRAKGNLLIGNNNTTLSAQQLGDVNAQLAAARAQKADAEAKAKLIRDMLRSGQPIESSDILNSELIRRLSEQRVTLRAQLAEQSSTLLDNHPRIKELKAQIAALDGQIKDEAATVARSLENDAKIAGERVDTLTASLDQLKGQAATTNENDVQLRELERDAKSQRDLLESYLAKYREATARDNINSMPADARVISRATVSNVPAYPKKVPAVMIATLTTLILAAGFVLTKELLGAPVRAVPVPRRPAAPAAPANEAVSARVAAALNAMRNRAAPSASPPLQPSPSLQEAAFPIAAIDEVARNLQHDGSAGRSIAVFGAAPGLDISWMALKFARALAENARVVLVGIGPADAAIRTTSNDPSASGLAELANGTASFGDIITKDRQSGLHLISSGHAAADCGQILSSPGMATSFDALARAYDHVVIAAGSIVGPELDAIGAIAPHAVLVASTLTNVGTASARERLFDAGFDEVTVLFGAAGNDVGETAAAA
jgi:polysaccharide biosynthesis transport protein